MKKILSVLTLFCLFANMVVAQAPQKINYQAVARDATGTILVNKSISVRFTIHNITATGATVYQESHPAMTNQFGLFTLLIGGGTILSGTFPAINWTTGDKYLQVEIIPPGNSVYVNMGTSQLVSVPFALVAQSVVNGDNWGTQLIQTDATLSGGGTTTNSLKIAQQGAVTGNILKWNGTTWVPGIDNTGWNLTGNSGTDPSTNFIGTIDNQPLKFKTNNYPSGLIDPVNQAVGLGGGALMANTGIKNTALGFNALSQNTTATNNTGIGWLALSSNVTGSANTAVGSSTLFLNSIGSHNTALGMNALYSNTSSFNTAIGSNSLAANTSGTSNTAVGFQALNSNTTGNSNAATGDSSLYSNTNGYGNTANGYQSLFSNVTGGNNTAMGWRALLSSNVGLNTAFGSQALQNTTTGDVNTACGAGALMANITGSYNTAIGYSANVGSSNLTNTTAIGYGAIVNASNKIRIGNTAITAIEGQVSFTTSDGRFKTNVSDNVTGLDFIMKLKPVIYNFEYRKYSQFLGEKFVDQEILKQKEAKVEMGFIAQDVERACKELGFSVSNLIHLPETDKDNYSLAYGQIVVPLVKAVQEQQQMIEELKKEISELKNKLKK